MKKTIQLLSIVSAIGFALQSCESQKIVLNREVETTNDGKMLLGHQTKSQLLSEPYSSWYTQEHDEYEVDQALLQELKKEKLSSYSLTVILGTWCEDSHREVPRLFKILEAVKYPENKVTLIAVNKKKEAPNGEESVFNIQKDPTIIVKKYGKEIGRIVESTKTGYLEKDLLEIIKKDNTSFKDLLK
jgi:hypothetical protein